MYTIYKIMNSINNKMYIGFTSKKLEERKYSHFIQIKHRLNYPLYNAFNKYGFNNFTWEEIYQTKNLQDALEKEAYFITYYNTRSNNIGYNIGYGGEAERLGTKMSLESKIKMSISAQNRGPNRNKKVMIIDQNNKEHEFNSLLEACKEFNINPRSASNIICGRAKKTRSGLILKLKEVSIG